jgi:integrase
MPHLRKRGWGFFMSTFFCTYTSGMGRPRNPKITEHERQDGGTVYRVRVRARGKQTAETFTSRAAARVFCENILEFGDEEAVAMLDRADRNHADYVPTLAEMLTRHTDELTGVDKRTKDDYHDLARRSWLPMLGKYPVDHLTRAHVARWVNGADGQSAPKTIKNAHSVLSAVLESAVRDGHMAVNPARGTRLPRSGEHEVEEIRFLSYAEFDRLITAIPDYWRPFVILLFGTGLRFSEATALQVHDVDTDLNTLRVMRAWKRERGGLRIGPPKSRASRRMIWLPVEVVEAAAPLLDRGGSDWLFTTTTGRAVMHSNFYNRVWKPACIKAGLDPRPRIHDARHTHASWLIAAGARLEVVQDRLGHEDYTTTRKVYAHLMPDLRREAGMAAHLAFASTSLRRQIEE